MFDKLPNYIRPTAFLSTIAGLILGILLLIPVVQLFVLFVIWFVGAAIVYLLKKNNFIGQFTNKEGIVIGCISGMFSVIGASITFLPLSMLIGAIFNTVSINMLFTTSVFSSFFSVFVLIMLIFFIGLINILFNIASALGVIAIFNNLLEDKKEENEFKIEL